MPENLSSHMNCLASSKGCAFVVCLQSVSKGIKGLPEPAIFHVACENVLISILGTICMELVTLNSHKDEAILQRFAVF